MRWKKGAPGLEVLSLDFKGRVDESSTPFKLRLRNVTLAMHGLYRCQVKTDLSLNEFVENPDPKLVSVIARVACSHDSWRLSANASDCRETLKLDCRHMFPKPSPSCGIFDARRDKLITALLLDITHEPPQQQSPGVAKPQLPQTYRIRYSNSIKLNEPSSQFGYLREFGNALEFRCDLSVPHTSWKLTLAKRLFDFRDSCDESPLEFVEALRATYTQMASSVIRTQQPSAAGAEAADFEMLASRLKYELLSADDRQSVVAATPAAATQSASFKKLVASSARASPAEQQASDEAGLGCFRKPKTHSRVRLSCESENSKLVGAQFLECQPDGKWAFLEKLNPACKDCRRKWRRVTTSRDGELVESAENEVGGDLSSDPLVVAPTLASAGNETRLLNANGRQTLPRLDPHWKNVARLLPTCVTVKKRVPAASNKLQNAGQSKQPRREGAFGGVAEDAAVASSGQTQKSVILKSVAQTLLASLLLTILLSL